MKCAPGAHECLLHEIFGILALPGHVDGAAQQLLPARQCLVLESDRQLGPRRAVTHVAPSLPPVESLSTWPSPVQTGAGDELSSGENHCE